MRHWLRALEQSPDGKLWDVVTNPGALGATFAGDTIGGKEFTKVKAMWGALGVANETSAATPMPVALTPQASGGRALPTHFVTTGANNEKRSCKGTPGQVGRVRIFNGEDFPIFLHFHDTAAVPTPGVGVVATIGVQSGVTYDVPDPVGTDFLVGIGVTVSKLVADADTTQIGANSVIDVYTK